MKTKRKTSKIAAMLLIAVLSALFLSTFGAAGGTLAAGSGIKVYFEKDIFEAESNGLTYAVLTAEGPAGQTVTVSYHTESGTAIDGVDYNGVSNTVSFPIGSNGIGQYRIAVKALGGTESRQKLRAEAGGEIYGRYFSVVIDDADGAEITRDRCRCYQPYDTAAEATVGVMQNIGEAAYFNDYKKMQEIANSGKGGIDGRSTWKSWKNGVSFSNETTTRWLNGFINPGFASAYTTYFIKTIDNDVYHSSTDIYLASGNSEFYHAYNKVTDGIPGTYLYISVEPYVIYNADRLDGRGMYLISQNKNPFDEDSDYVDAERRFISKNSRHIFWMQEKDKWYADTNSLVDSAFWRIDPYNGELNAYLAIYNKNREVDIEVRNLVFFMALVDETVPTIVGQYLDDSRLESEGKLRICLRFSEPVYSSLKKSLEVKLNNGTTPYYADYVEGNYSDTLIYEMKAPLTEIRSATYTLPTDDIGDMAYNMDAYKNIRNNKVQYTDRVRDLTLPNGAVTYVRPQLSIDKKASTAPKNRYDLILSMNDNGSLPINEGTIYYDWSLSDSKATREDPSSYRYSRKLSEEDMGSIHLSLVKNEAEGLMSGSYYLHALVVGKYGLTATETYGPYVLDGDPPILWQEPLPLNELKTKRYVFENRKVGGAGIVGANLIVRRETDDGEVVLTYPLMTDGVPVAAFSVLGDGKYQYLSDIGGEDADRDGYPDLPTDEFILGLMGEDPRINLTVAFELLDSAGNRSTSNAVSVVYDKRDTFKVSHEFPGSSGYLPITDVTSPYPAYDIQSVNRDEGKGIRVTVHEEDRSQIVEGVSFRISVGDRTYPSLPSDPFTVVIDDLTPGFYQLIPGIYGEVAGSEVDLVANPISFYLTDGLDDLTENRKKASGDLVLAGNVFRIPDARFYYLDKNEKVASIPYGAVYNESLEKYEGGSTQPAFSSVTEAKKYVRYTEYQDLTLVTLTATQASMLNSSSGTTTYVKAAGETRTAQEGQLWIRYKKKSWNAASSAYGWAYYYYGESGAQNTGIDLNRLSENLLDSIGAIVNRIVAAGSTVWLVEESDLDSRTGAPYLSLSQIHAAAESVAATKNGNAFLNPPVYEGDAQIYRNTVTIDGVEYPLATNMALSLDTDTYLYYRYYESQEWYPISAASGQTLKTALKGGAGGIYTIREYGHAGVSEFNVCIDSEIPVARIVINTDVYEMDGTVVNYSGSSAYLDALMGESDPYAYVAVYSYPSRTLQTVLYRDDVPGYDLGSGNYYLQVGDRSGNIVTYTILLSGSRLDVQMSESGTQSGVVLRVLNRDESEIYSYEVYLNEELLTSEYAPVRILRDPGVYRAVVTDIYGNSVTITQEYDFPSPRINWFYLNSSGGYSRYDPDNVVSMRIAADPESARISNVFTSTRIRLAFDTSYGESAIRFEMTGLSEGGYSYAEATGVLTINTDENWRLRVWFEDYPENDHTYVCRHDVEAPEFDASFVGTAYKTNVGLDDEELLASCAEGEVISLGALSIGEGETAAMSITDGSVICGSHIIVGLFDPSGIRSYSVTRNGQPLDLSLNEDGQLLINNFGVYVITATDNLGNRASFRFENVKEAIASATLDGEPISEGQTYGKDALIAESSYAATVTALIRTPEQTYTYVFDYDGTTLTYGQYIAVTDEEEGLGKKYAEWIASDGFVFRPADDSVRRGRWYDVITDFDFRIAVMADDAGSLHYGVFCSEDRIHAELLVSVGNNKRPSLFTADLSKAAPAVTLLTDGRPAEIVESLNYIYVAGTLTVGEADADVVEILAGYSADATEPELTPIYRNGEFLSDFKGTEDGFYTVAVTNIFGNRTVYRIQKIRAFRSVVTVTYLDGMTREFASAPSLICSNSRIELVVYSDDVRFEVNGERYDGNPSGGVTALLLDRPGKYDVRVVASNGITGQFAFEIAADSEFLFREEWLAGYNEEALLRDQGYTNAPLDVLPGDRVEYVDVVKDGVTTVLYDNVSETKVGDRDGLAGTIGRSGAGEYRINFRNVYGDLVSKTIHFNPIPSLALSRKTTADPNRWESYSWEKALDGFYSNYMLRFSTESKRYEFSINGTPVSLDEPKIISLDQSSGNGSFEYEVRFLDEYGNTMTIRAILRRADVQIDASAMTEIEAEGVRYTRDNVSLSFDASSYSATVSRDGGDPIEYYPGTTFYRDGEYAFVVSDIAGNRLAYTIVHKSLNHYTLTDPANDQPVIAGGVVNNSSVVFTPEDDSVIQTAVRDGKVVDLDGTRAITQTGHWELLITDFLGNTSYTDFYLINNSLGEFEYQAPYNYYISEIWKTGARGDNVRLDPEEDGGVRLTENGDYVIGVTGIGTISSFRFTVTIDNTPPSITLEGVENRGVTARNVSIKGLRSGDNVKVYKNGVLVSDVDVGISASVPEITTGGDYRVVVTNLQGVSSEYTFTRKSIANAATSIFLIVVIALAATGVAIGLLSHTKLKTDD